MRYLKKLVLVWVVVLAFCAVGGATSASATVLCSAAESPCPSGQRYPAETVLNGVMKEGALTFKTESIEAGCLGYEFEGKTSTAGSATETVEAPNKLMVVRSCSSNQSLPAVSGYSIHYLPGTSNGRFTIKEFKIEITGSGLSCTYGGTFEAGILTGGNPAALKISASVPKTGGGPFCGATMTMQSGPIEFTAPKPLYVAAS